MCLRAGEVGTREPNVFPVRSYLELFSMFYVGSRILFLFFLESYFYFLHSLDLLVKERSP